MYIGTDSEHAMVDSHGNLMSAIDKIPGRKNRPHPLPNGGGLQVDNVLLEWNSPVASTEDQFVQCIFDTLEDIKHIFLKNRDILFKSSYLFPKEELNHPKAVVAGCQSDYNAWEWDRTGDFDLSKNPRVVLRNTNLRTAAAHIHISPLPFEDISKFVLLQDMHLGLVSLFLDDDTRRRILYGKAGSFRPKRYRRGITGMEYRVIGAFWVKEERFIRWVYKTNEFIYNNYKDMDTPPVEVREAIDNYNLPLAGKLIDTLGVKWPE